MSLHSKREFLSAQLGASKQMLEEAGEDPIMSLNLSQRIEELKSEIGLIPMSGKEARATLLFFGDPVQGSMGIDLKFSNEVLSSFQNIVMTDYADRWHGTVGLRGRRAGENESRLLLAALPRGSFGMELVQSERADLTSHENLAVTLSRVTCLLEAAAKGDEEFAQQLAETDSRVIRNVSHFLKTISDSKAGLKLESGSSRCTIYPDSARAAYERVSSTQADEEELQVSGFFQGVLLNDWRFNFLSDSNQVIKGKLDESLSKDDAVAFGELLDKRCEAFLTKRTISFRTGKITPRFTLTGLSPMQ
jgi:hypothetical protein